MNSAPSIIVLVPRHQQFVHPEPVPRSAQLDVDEEQDATDDGRIENQISGQ